MLSTIKVVVFTAVFNDYVPIDRPRLFEKIPGWDYVLFTNLDPHVFGETAWTIKQVPFPNEVANLPGKYIYANRYYKWKPHLHFDSAQYDVAIYVDGFQVPNAQYANIWRQYATYVADPANPPLIQCPHPANDCIYKELVSIVNARKDTAPRMDAVRQYLKTAGFPTGIGLLWNGCYVTRLADGGRISQLWRSLWEDMLIFTYRDQSLWMYQLWRHNAIDLITRAPLDQYVAQIDSNLNHVYL
jgi:hypothetical protein